MHGNDTVPPSTDAHRQPQTLASEFVPGSDEHCKPGLTAAEQADLMMQRMRDRHEAPGDSSESKKPKAAGKGKTEMKRPASAMAGKAHTTKAAAMKTNLKKEATAPTTVRKEVPGWTMAKRMKTYPEGCSKCAYKTPGCTLSCFKARGQVS